MLDLNTENKIKTTNVFEQQNLKDLGMEISGILLAKFKEVALAHRNEPLETQARGVAKGLGLSQSQIDNVSRAMTA